jgi:hypothetical protein
MRGPGRVVTDRDSRGLVEGPFVRDCLSPNGINLSGHQQGASELGPGTVESSNDHRCHTVPNGTTLGKRGADGALAHSVDYAVRRSPT